MTTYDDTWTATQDCYMLGYSGSTYANPRYVVLDSVQIQNWQSTHNDSNAFKFGMFLPVKKGQKVRVYVGDSRRGANNIVFYGTK